MKIKKRSLPKKTTKKVVDKEQTYLDSLDLNSLWEEFAHTTNSNGTISYKTAWSFTVKKEKDKAKQRMLYWLIGPVVQAKPGQQLEFSLPQFDFETKRKQGFWYSSENIESFKKDIAAKASAYDAVREAGKVNLHTIALLNTLLNRLEEEYGGNFFLPSLSQKENTLRVQLYFQLLKQIIDLSNSAQVMYARSQGLDLERLDQFFAMFGSQMGRVASSLIGGTQQGTNDDAGHHRLKSQFDQVVEMVANKATEYALPLPDNIAEAIQQTSEQTTKKSKVN